MPLFVGRQEGHPACKKHGGYGCGGVVSPDGVASTRTAGASASIITPGSTKIQKNDGVHKQEVVKPSLNAAQPYAKAEGCVHDDPPRADKLRKGWLFRVGTWNVDSLTGRSGELVEALAERRMDVACVQETRWRGSGCRFFGAIGKRYKLFWLGSKAKTDGVGIFVAEKWVDSVVSIERHSKRVLVVRWS